MNTILAIDTSGAGFSVALLRSGMVLCFREERQRGKQAALLAPVIAEAMMEAQIGYAELDAVVAVAGPGGFTGLRIGLSAAQGIGLAASIPVYGVNTLAVIAHAAQRQGARGKLLAVIDAGKQELAAQSYFLDDKGISKNGEPMLAPPETLAAACEPERTVAGAIFLLPEKKKPIYTLPLVPDAQAAALLAFSDSRWVLPPQPVYVRPPDAKLPTA